MRSIASALAIIVVGLDPRIGKGERARQAAKSVSDFRSLSALF